MPYQNVPDDMQDKMESCVMQLVDKGQDKEAAIAICYTSVVGGKSLDLAIEEYHLGLKSGARNNTSDKQRIRSIRKAAREIDGLTMEMEPKDDDETTEDRIIGKAGSLTMEGGDPLFFTTVKATGDWELDVLGVPYGGPNGGKDSDGEYFSPETKTYDDQFPSPPAVYYHGFSPEGKPMGEPAIIGKVQRIWKDAKGWWYRVILDKTNELSKRIWQSAQQGKARASSGSIAHMVRKTRDGHITHWPVVELSLIDAEGKRQPANQYAVAMLAAKALYQASGVEFPDIPEAAQTAGEAETKPPALPTVTITRGVNIMPDLTLEQITAQVKAQLQAEQETARAEQEKVEAAVKKAKEEWEAEAAKSRRLPDGGMPAVTHYAEIGKYDDLEPGEHALMIGILGSAEKSQSDGSVKALAMKLEAAKDEDYALGKRALKGLGMKANELNQSTLASYGDEWVGITYSTNLWEKIRLGTPVVGRVPSVIVPQGSESIIIPLAGASATFYKVAQASAQASNTLGAVTNTVPTSKMATTSKTLSVAKMGASVIWTSELEEDSLIPWMSTLRADLAAEGAEVLEHVVIDGDTDETASTNINDIAGTPAGTEPFLLFNGFRKSCLVTTTANSRSAAGGFDVTDFLETAKLMGLAGKNAMQRDQMAFILDAWTAWKALTLPEVQTRDVFSQPTIENGVLTSIYGRDVIATANMHRANQDATYGLKVNSAGKADLDTAANNLYGAILAVRFDQWLLGFKRRMSFETLRIPRADATEITVLMRVGLAQRDTEASAVSYYVGV